MSVAHWKLFRFETASSKMDTIVIKVSLYTALAAKQTEKYIYK